MISENQTLIFSSSSTIQSVDLEASEIKAINLDIPTQTAQGLKNNWFLQRLVMNCYYTTSYRIPVMESVDKMIWGSISIQLLQISDQIGFEYDRFTDDYVILRIHHDGKHHVLTGREFEVFSLKTESWKKGNLPWEIVSLAKAQSGILVNEALRWKIEYACLESIVFSFDAILRYVCNYI